MDHLHFLQKLVPKTILSCEIKGAVFIFEVFEVIEFKIELVQMFFVQFLPQGGMDQWSTDQLLHEPLVHNFGSLNRTAPVTQYS